MGSIAPFHWIVAVALVFCGVLQWQDIEPPQYICFSGVNLDIATLQNPATIKYIILYKYYSGGIETAAICKL